MSGAKQRDEVADYTTVGLAIGLSWKQARNIAKQIVSEKRAKAEGGK